MHKKQTILSIVGACLCILGAVSAQYVIALDEPITLEAPVISEVELVSVRIFPGEKRIEVVATAGGVTVVAKKSGATYDAIIGQVDVPALTALFLPDLRSAAAAKLNSTTPLQ